MLNADIRHEAIHVDDQVVTIGNRSKHYVKWHSEDPHKTGAKLEGKEPFHPFGSLSTVWLQHVLVDLMNWLGLVIIVIACPVPLVCEVVCVGADPLFAR